LTIAGGGFPSGGEGSGIIELLWLTTAYGGAPGAAIGLGMGVVLHRHEKRFPSRPLSPPVDRWSAVVARCEHSVRRVAAVVGAIPASPAKDWMNRITAQFNAELDDVRALAALARAMGAAHEDHPASQRLFAAARDFAAFEQEVGRVALKMFDHPELDRARTDLELLEQQLPNLRP
jgi:hypothetical protein